MTKNDNGSARDGSTATNPENHWSQAAQRHYEPTGNKELAAEVIFAVAEADGIAPHELKSPPLYESIDAPALEDTFFGPDVASDSRQGVGTVEFQYRDYLVTVQSDGWIQVYERIGTEEP